MTDETARFGEHMLSDVAFKRVGLDGSGSTGRGKGGMDAVHHEGVARQLATGAVR
jgi:hypothetical protein